MIDLATRLLKVAASRPPDFIIGGVDDPYLKRWWIIPRNRVFNIYLHQFLRSDEDRAHHDHPWTNLSIVLRGEYTEHSIKAGGVIIRTVRKAGAIKLRRAVAAHRIELHAGECWTLFITGPVVRLWGFHCPAGWRRWQDFVAENPGEIGKGCD
jgi:hypothetical protein